VIEFSCNACAKEYQVNDDKAGKRGKCPNCGSIMVVPEHSTTEMIFDESQMSVRNPQLQEIFDTIQSLCSESILKQFVIDGDVVALQIQTGEFGSRSQLVAMTVSGDDEAHLIIQSNVGVVSELSSLETALRCANARAVMNVSIDDDNQLMVRMLTEIDRSPTEQMLNVIMVAVFADGLEEVIFGWDVE